MKRLMCILISMLSLYSFCVQAFATDSVKVNIYKSVPQSGKMIALTFDDGPHPRYTEQILDILKKHDARATFFVIGENIEYYDKGILKRIIDGGHEIGNHTFNHGHTKQMSEQDFLADVNACHQLVKERYGYEMNIFRPPEGYIDNKVKKAAEELGYSIILWSIDTRDWEHTASSAIVGNIERHAGNGDIILMHDYVSGKSTTLDSLDKIIPKLKAEGYKFVTVSELINTHSLASGYLLFN